MSNEFKVVSGSTNVLLIINGKGVPAQVLSPSETDANEHYRFLVRDDRLGDFFPYVERLERLVRDMYGAYESAERVFAVMRGGEAEDAETADLREMRSRARELGLLGGDA